MMGRLILFFSVMVFAGVCFGAKTDQAGESVPLDALRNFAAIFEKVKQSYVDSVSDDQLIEYAIHGMLEGLDPHSRYFLGEDYVMLQEETTGQFGGIGIEVDIKDELIHVVSPIDDTPAQRAGIQPGDIITRLDDKSVKGMSLHHAVNLMRGAPGSSIMLTLIRSGLEQPLTLNLERALIQHKSVRGKTLEQYLIYLRISNFQINTLVDARKMLDTLKRENQDRIEGLILDLRNNPGGILKAAVNVADLFLTDGLIVYTEGRSEDANTQFYADGFDMLNAVPIVVLVNGGSASASEIVAGALQDQQRALIIGESTFGKGSVQSVFPINQDSGLKLTTARYFTPSGRSIQAEGISPDILIENVKLQYQDQQQLKEVDLDGHLIQDGKNNHDERRDEGGNSSDLAKRDYVLYEGLNILKAIIFSRRASIKN